MHILLYVLDALRVDHLSCYGYHRRTSPHIDDLACDGVVFENCFTSTTWTRPVAASILTGVYPGVHLTRSREDMFSTHLLRLPEFLGQLGFKTAAFSTMGNLDQDIGFGRGFDQYHNLFRDADILSKRRQLDAAEEGLMHALENEIALPRAEDVHDFLFPWLNKYRNVDTFSFVWSIETHVPYRAPEGFHRFASDFSPRDGERADIRQAQAADRERLIDLYDDEILYNDHCIGNIVDYLKKMDIYDDTMIIIVSDHGDAFYEHGFYAHGHAPYEELIHIPMVMKFPNNLYAGRRVSELVELIDIFSTVVATVGSTLDEALMGSIQGQNLVSLIEGQHDRARNYVFSDTQSLDIHNRYLSVRSDRWKYIRIIKPKRNGRMFSHALRHILRRRILLNILRSPRHFFQTYFAGENEYLFDLALDSDEQRNLINEETELADHFRMMLEEWLQENAELAAQVSDIPDSHEESDILRDHLKRLGYL